MEEVYRARDGKLGRDVAIKVLPDEFAENEERLARFKREAKVLASLNHPGIAAIHGLEESAGTHYLVLELMPGETLAERISRGPIPVEGRMGRRDAASSLLPLRRLGRRGTDNRKGQAGPSPSGAWREPPSLATTAGSIAPDFRRRHDRRWADWVVV